MRKHTLACFLRIRKAILSKHLKRTHGSIIAAEVSVGVREQGAIPQEEGRFQEHESLSKGMHA